ncbi:isoleucine--tRNA ligase [Helicobacter monodelphidis]|uniref:isoleucine--tRNA ligase n=1 Tax=Helicobacter sp. 15-1451 TaxID=2004995 RepID=UPI000DCD5AF5|nr:isoleucine--tRNA ligase [Helicobacter sp. 15-1451]RAX58610.1 isoleucine--tRNA ligase [Helicobacter sp. 15-1451]
MDYKETLILPQTTFPMRGNLPQNESKRYERWQQEKKYHIMKNNRQTITQKFNLHDGPPYANGELHIGHALNKILKDMIMKIYYYRGYAVRYLPGWDCHGLPIEQQIEKKLGKDKKDGMPKEKIRELCRSHAAEFIEIQKKGFLALGVLGDFENPYKTMEFTFEAEIYRCLCAIASKGLLCEREKPVYWSWACETALAEAEVEYKDKQSDSIFVGFDLQKDALESLGVSQAALVIWTTTPWTLPANLGIALRPDTPYVLSSDGKIVAKELFAQCKENGVLQGEIVKEFNSTLLENKLAKNPLNGRDSKILLGDHVLLTDGSGCVHTAPGHGEDDYLLGLRYQLGVLMPVDDKGCFDESVVHLGLLPNPESFVGVHIFKAQERILELLGDSLLKQTKITHSYPHCWRSGKPVIFRATKQWFIMMDKPFTQEGKTLRQVAGYELQKVKFYPENGVKRIGSMIENRPDWCISRQRDWGVPIAFLRDKASKEVLLDPVVLDHIAQIFEKEGCDAWWTHSVAELLPDSYSDKVSRFEKINHILDVWFDSGSTWAAVLKSPHYDAGDYPASLYLEGSDQHRGWFQSSLLVSCAIHEQAPFKSIITHGFTMDKNGDKMSKSKGNAIVPSEITKEFGSEILRLWVAMSDYQNDQNISSDILKQSSESYKKIRNTLRFLLANTNDLEVLELDSFSSIDLWILNLAKNVFAQTDEALLNYDFSKACALLSHFIVNELSGIYMDLCKDILYCESKTSKRRRSAQSVMALITQKLFELLAPILTYTIDEAIEHCGGYLKSINSDAFSLCYTPITLNIELKEDFDSLLEIRSLFLEKIDILKKEGRIKSTLEVSLKTPKNTFKDLNVWLMISEASENLEASEILESFEYQNEYFEIHQARWHKCPRCWQFLSDKPEELCGRCAEVMRNV